jgi:GT2 family glycosyltransferase
MCWKGAMSLTAPLPDVSVIIVNWNTRDLLRGCLQSVLTETTASTEVIVIDNASADGSAAMVAAEFPQVLVIANTDNKGFAAANNQGLRIAKGRNLLLLNPDTIILDGAIDRMLDWLVDHPDVGGAGCQVWETPDRIQLTCFADPGPLNLTIIQMGLMRLARFVPAFGHPWYLNWDRLSEKDVDVVSGMFLLVPRAVFDAVGLLDEDFFVYAEEADWCRRIRKAGWRVVFTPVARIIHLDGGAKSTVQIRPKMHVQLQKSLLIYVRKHNGAFGYWAVKGLMLASSTARAVVFGAVALLRGDDVNRARVRLSRASLRYLLTGRAPL